jgi:antitoxin (DNA-binding transcriptional repressor) of toxin-antitoxin stability system
MKTAGIRELKAQLSMYLREVQSGETVLVTDRGRVVAELRPPGAEAAPLDPEEAKLRRLADEGLIRLPTLSREEFLREWKRFKPPNLPAEYVEELLDEEREERF